MTATSFAIGPGQRALQVRIRGGHTFAGGGSAYMLLQLFHLGPTSLSRVFAAQEYFEESWTVMESEQEGSQRTHMPARRSNRS